MGGALASTRADDRPARIPTTAHAPEVWELEPLVLQYFVYSLKNEDGISILPVVSCIRRRKSSVLLIDAAEPLLPGL